jgi:hypothetical protein
MQIPDIKIAKAITLKSNKNKKTRKRIEYLDKTNSDIFSIRSLVYLPPKCSCIKFIIAWGLSVAEFCEDIENPIPGPKLTLPPTIPLSSVNKAILAGKYPKLPSTPNGIYFGLSRRSLS